MRRKTPRESIDRRLEHLGRPRYGVFAREEARRRAVSDEAIDRRLADGAIDQMLPGVFRLAAVPETWESWLMAITLWGKGMAWVSHRAAAALWELDGFERGPIELVTVRDLRCSSPMVVTHRVTDMPRCDVARFKGIAVTTVHRTLIDLGAVVGPDEVELATECAIRRRLTNEDRLWRRLRALQGRGRAGPPVLRTVLRRRGRGVEPTGSALETRFLQFLRRYGLPVPNRQVRHYDEHGFIARVDFYYDDRDLVVEVDSRAHHTRQVDWEGDLRRRNALTNQGRRVLHVTHRRMVDDPQSLAQELLTGLQSRV